MSDMNWLRAISAGGQAAWARAPFEFVSDGVSYAVATDMHMVVAIAGAGAQWQPMPPEREEKSESDRNDDEYYPRPGTADRFRRMIDQQPGRERVCATCKGEGEVNCGTCSGSGQERCCYRCDDHFHACRECEGKKRKKCNSCDGVRRWPCIQIETTVQHLRDAVLALKLEPIKSGPDRFHKSDSREQRLAFAQHVEVDPRRLALILPYVGGKRLTINVWGQGHEVVLFGVGWMAIVPNKSQKYESEWSRGSLRIVQYTPPVTLIGGAA